MNEKTKQTTWRKPHHPLIRNLVYPFLAPYSRLAYGVRVERFRQQGDRAYLILMNHTTAFDQFFVGMAFKGAIYYMATEDIFSLGWISKVLRALVAPIPIKKQTTDISAVRTCIKLAREGGTICLAPEGNRTYHGRTVYMNPAIAKMAKKMKLPIALFRIEGGYGVQPRWAHKLRRGTMAARVSEVIEPEEYEAMTDEALMERIRTGLYVDEAQITGLYRGNRRAEYLERAIYVCPECGLSKHESKGNYIRCCSCGRRVLYGEDKTLTGEGFQLPFRFVNDWYAYQEDFVNRLNPADHVAAPIFRDQAKVMEVEVYKRKHLLRKWADIALYGDRVVLDEGKENEMVLHFDDITAATCLGKNKLNIYHGKNVYQFKGDVRFNALKYMNLYFRYRNIARGEENGKFLGL